MVLGLNHKTASIADRERWGLSSFGVPLFLKEILKIPSVCGAVYVATCNRVEFYLSVEKEFSISSVIELWKAEPSYVYGGEQAFSHLLRVAAGLDSLVLGENQVMGQIKQAYLQSVEIKTADALIHFAFQRALNVAKKIRTETGIAKSPTSVSSVAVMLIEQIFGDFSKLKTLVVGTGETGSQTAELLVKRGVKNLIVANRTLCAAETLAASLKASVCPFEELEKALALSDMVITATASSTPIIFKEMFLRKNSPTVLVDLGVPRDVDPEVGNAEGIYLYNVDDLKTIADKNRVFRTQEAMLAEKIVSYAAESFQMEWKKRSRRMMDISILPDSDHLGWQKS
ncbi:MAG: glutamyl-tRNA reductase [Deltaproteobacteria bacterium]|nr:glutamyl-tRNA reductase [Deltaproteobacteria bacterium]